jgi:hypothetical protein
MPDNIASHLDVNTSGYSTVPAPPPSNVQIEQPLLPVRDSKLRFSAPNIPGSFPSSDTLIGYHLGGMIPQWRIPTVPTQSSSGSGATTTTTVISSSSSSSTSNPPKSQTASVTTAVLSPASQFTGVVTMAKAFIVLSISVNAAARVRLYSTAAAQNVDKSRPITQGPGFGTEQGIIGDVVLTNTPVVWYTENMVGANGNNPQNASIYCTVDNLTASSTAIQVSISFVPLQS